MLLGALLSLLLSAAPAPACDGAQLTPVHVVGVGDAAPLAADLEVAAQGLYEEVSTVTGADDCAPIRVDLTTDLKLARRVLPAWHVPPWAAGAAQADRRSILLTVHTDGHRHDRVQVLTHELAHLSIAQAAGGHPVPRWFNEGVARTIAGEHSVEDAEVLARAKIASRLFPLEGLESSFPAGDGDAAIAYAVSGRAISLLMQEHGRGAIADVLAGVRDGVPFDQALHAATSWRTFQLDAQVKRSVGTAAAWMTVFAQADLGMLLAGVLSAIAAVLVFRRRRRELSDMPDDVAPRPAFDVRIVRLPSVGLSRG